MTECLTVRHLSVNVNFMLIRKGYLALSVTDRSWGTEKLFSHAKKNNTVSKTL